MIKNLIPNILEPLVPVQTEHTYLNFPNVLVLYSCKGFKKVYDVGKVYQPFKSCIIAQVLPKNNDDDNNTINIKWFKSQHC